MKRLIFALLATLALPWVAEAACTGASPRWASTADYASLSPCVAGATAGDTILVSGNATWSSTLTLTRGVNLIGVGNPTITRVGKFVLWEPSADALAAHDLLTIRGFIFDASDSTSADCGYAGLIQVSSSATNYVKLVIMGNTFMDTAARAVYLNGRFLGAISGNIFDHVAIVLSPFGNHLATWQALTQEYAASENLFFENNTIQFSRDMTGYMGWIEGGNGGRSVVRYNTWNYANVLDADEIWDLHGLQGAQPPEGITGCDNYSNMVSEFYGNATINAVALNRWMAHRGGWLLMFYNSFTGTYNPPQVHVFRYYCDSCQAVGSYVQEPSNSYYWRNMANGSEDPAVVITPDPGCPSDPVTENVDFWNYKATFTAAPTTGMGCGTLAARPATCTAGVGYWATNQSCSDLTGMVGASPSTTISGTFYKCTADNTWTSYYTPYTYPHPLTVTPAAPTNVRIR